MSSPLNELPDQTGSTAPVPTVHDEGFGTPAPVIAPAEKRFPAWSGWDVLAVAVFTGVCVILFIAIGLFVSGILGGTRTVSVSELTSNARVIRTFLAAQAGAYLVILGCIFLLVRSRAPGSFGQAIQWNWPGSTGLVFFFGGILLALVIDGLARFLPMPKSLPMDDLFNNRTNAYLLAAFGLTLAPLMEEVFFRGLLYPVLRRATGLFAAVLLTAAAFAAIHSMQLGYAWAPLVSIFVVGVVFTVTRERRTSVAASFLMHCGYNFTLFSMLWFASDHFRHLEKVAG